MESFFLLSNWINIFELQNVICITALSQEMAINKWILPVNKYVLLVSVEWRGSLCTSFVLPSLYITLENCSFKKLIFSAIETKNNYICSIWKHQNFCNTINWWQRVVTQCSTYGVGVTRSHNTKFVFYSLRVRWILKQI